MVFQDPMTSLNPVVPIGVQVTEVLRRHTDLDREAARAEAEQLLRRVGIPDPNRRLKEYPHQLSGGMGQRVVIAMALANDRTPHRDEPTTALDITVQSQVLALLLQVLQAKTRVGAHHDHARPWRRGTHLAHRTASDVRRSYRRDRAGRRELFA